MRFLMLLVWCLLCYFGFGQGAWELGYDGMYGLLYQHGDTNTLTSVPCNNPDGFELTVPYSESFQNIGECYIACYTTWQFAPPLCNYFTISPNTGLGTAKCNFFRTRDCEESGDLPLEGRKTYRVSFNHDTGMRWLEETAFDCQDNIMSRSSYQLRSINDVDSCAAAIGYNHYGEMSDSNKQVYFSFSNRDGCVKLSSNECSATTSKGQGYPIMKVEWKGGIDRGQNVMTEPRSTPSPTASPTTSPTWATDIKSFGISSTHIYLGQPGRESNRGQLDVYDLELNLVAKSILPGDVNYYCGNEVFVGESYAFQLCPKTLIGTRTANMELHMFKIAQTPTFPKFIQRFVVEVFHVNDHILLTCENQVVTLNYFRLNKVSTHAITIDCKEMHIQSTDELMLFQITSGAGKDYFLTDKDGLFTTTIYRLNPLIQPFISKDENLLFFVIPSFGFTRNSLYRRKSTILNSFPYHCDPDPRYSLTGISGTSNVRCRNHCSLHSNDCVVSQYENGNCLLFKQCLLVSAPQSTRETTLASVAGEFLHNTTVWPDVNCLEGSLTKSPSIHEKGTAIQECEKLCLENQRCHYFRVTNLPGDAKSFCNLFASNCLKSTNTIDEQNVILYQVER